MNAALLENAIDCRLILPEVHGPLLRDLARVVREANIPSAAVFKPMSEHCTEAEIAYVKALKRQSAAGVYGLTYLGKRPHLPVMDRMTAIAGACLRNYLSARVMVVQEVLSCMKADTMPTPTVLLIPNFQMGHHDGGAVPEWQVSQILALLYARQTDGLQTVLYAHDLAGVESLYGRTVRQHIETHFLKIDA